MSDGKARALIVKTLKEKSIMKNQVFHLSKEKFNLFKHHLAAINTDLQHKVNEGDTKLAFNYQDKGDFEAIFTMAGDTLIFHMHSNIFCFERSHPVWQTNYIKDDEQRAYCGVIHIYNFLTDSFRYNRENDLGYMIARIFINKEGHYFVEGKRQMGFLYNNFAQDKLDSDAALRIIESALLYTLDFDLLLPNYDQVKMVSISEIAATSDMLRQKTGKRMGFIFQADI